MNLLNETNIRKSLKFIKISCEEMTVFMKLLLASILSESGSLYHFIIMLAFNLFLSQFQEFYKSFIYEMVHPIITSGPSHHNITSSFF